MLIICSKLNFTNLIQICIVEDDRELKEGADVILLDVNLPDGEGFELALHFLLNNMVENKYIN